MGSTRGLISAVDQTASVRHQPFERSRPEQQKPEAKKNGDCNRAERVLIDSEYLSYCSEGNHYDRKGCHKAYRNEHRPCVTGLGTDAPRSMGRTGNVHGAATVRVPASRGIITVSIALHQTMGYSASAA